jgi:hypothetical protein
MLRSWPGRFQYIQQPDPLLRRSYQQSPVDRNSNVKQRQRAWNQGIDIPRLASTE